MGRRKVIDSPTAAVECTNEGNGQPVLKHYEVLGPKSSYTSSFVLFHFFGLILFGRPKLYGKAMFIIYLWPII